VGQPQQGLPIALLRQPGRAEGRGEAVEASPIQPGEELEAGVDEAEAGIF